MAEAAKKEETSLNQYIVSLLSERNALRTVENLQVQIAALKQLSANAVTSTTQEAEEEQQKPSEEKAVAYSVAENSPTYAESSATE